MRQLTRTEFRRPLDPIAAVSGALRGRLEALGVVFGEDDDPGLPSRSQTAAVELAMGVQFAFEHFFDYGDGDITIRSEHGATPQTRLAQLRAIVPIAAAEIRYSADAWE